MPRTRKTEPTTVSELTDEQRSDLTIYFRQKITAAQAEAELAKAAAKVKTDAVNSLFARVKAELDRTRIEFQGHIDRAKMTDAEYVAAENKRRQLDKDGGLKTGDQLALDFSGADTADEIARTRRMGAAAYHANVLPTEPPKEIHALMQPHWLDGWQEEQRKTAEAMGRAEDLLSKRGQPDAGSDDEPDLNAGSDPETGEGDGEPAQAVDLAKVRQSRRKSFDEKHPEPALA